MREIFGNVVIQKRLVSRPALLRVQAQAQLGKGRWAGVACLCQCSYLLIGQ